ncbi:MAG: YraN family protein [Lachnospiraceae bacterium]|nr:YraN family protein [Lachnospiraceae bacterium]
MNTRKLGTEKEDRAAAYIESHGGKVTERNFRSRMGEIDLIARDSGTICFIEVKYRSGEAKGHPLEAVGTKKQFTICRVSDYYRMKHHLPEDIPYRFDVVSIIGNEITWHKNAFQYISI